MSVTVDLPRSINGGELTDAIEEAAKEIGCFVRSKKSIYYKPGSVKAVEAEREITVHTPMRVTRGIFKRTTVTEANPYVYFRITIPTGNRFNSVEFQTFVKKWDTAGGHGEYFKGKEVPTSDPDFTAQFQPTFEMFLKALYQRLNQAPD